MIQLHAAEALGNLAESTEKNKLAIVDAGAAQSIKELIVESPPDVQIQMARCIKALSCVGMHSPFNYFLSSHPPLGEIKDQLSKMGISEVLTRLPDRYRSTTYENRSGTTGCVKGLFEPW